LIKATPTRYFTPAATLILAEMAENLAIQSECKTFKPGAYRDKSGVGRNLTIEILEFFDKAGLTQRTKSGRRILTPAKEIFAISEAITAKSIL
jgi:selenocysteine-specific elongation factor